MTEIELFIKDRIDIDIIMIGETWLYTDAEGFFNIPSFSAFFHSNNESRGGETAIFIKQNIQDTVLEVFNQFNTIIVSLNYTSPSLKIAVCYKKASDNNSELLAHLDLIIDKYKNIVLMGDINIDLLTYTEFSRSYKLIT